MAHLIDLSPPPATVLDKEPTLTVEGLSGRDALLSNSHSWDVQHEVDLHVSRRISSGLQRISQLARMLVEKQDQDRHEQAFVENIQGIHKLAREYPSGIPGIFSLYQGSLTLLFCQNIAIIALQRALNNTVGQTVVSPQDLFEARIRNDTIHAGREKGTPLNDEWVQKFNKAGD